ncbi:pancreatic triacylglycerol lipase-like [Episyrphus balteatus]|uniref:pancreatic triacylglycerol lipase-like n=1 Tax=Episyrphus balteatus TaxID=286459 RepID=UPI0024856131|nr:pancreatic triacylglycerol lipase-like [Episyrphus balteatus]
MDKLRFIVLDASYPLFLPLPFFLTTVNKNDAEFVQAIHTEVGTFGQPFSLGHVDFWPNGGRAQPGCSNGLLIFPFSDADICGHRRSWRFWAESVANLNNSEPTFLGFPAFSYLTFLLDGEDNLEKKTVEMGINCPMSAKGNYYLKTNSRSPFAKGKDGY